MTGGQVLAVLRSRGVILEPQDGKLHYRGPKAAFTSELLQHLAKHKAEVLTLLAERPVDYAATACVCSVPVGRTGPDRCNVCALPLICPECGRCRGCKLRLRFPKGGR